MHSQWATYFGPIPASDVDGVPHQHVFSTWSTLDAGEISVDGGSS
jgi:hypothetical protein